MIWPIRQAMPWAGRLPIDVPKGLYMADVRSVDLQEMARRTYASDGVVSTVLGVMTVTGLVVAGLAAVYFSNIEWATKRSSLTQTLSPSLLKSKTAKKVRRVLVWIRPRVAKRPLSAITQLTLLTLLRSMPRRWPTSPKRVTPPKCWPTH